MLYNTFTTFLFISALWFTLNQPIVLVANSDKYKKKIQTWYNGFNKSHDLTYRTLSYVDNDILKQHLFESEYYHNQNDEVTLIEQIKPYSTIKILQNQNNNQIETIHNSYNIQKEYSLPNDPLGKQDTSNKKDNNNNLIPSIDPELIYDSSLYFGSLKSVMDGSKSKEFHEKSNNEDAVIQPPNTQRGIQLLRQLKASNSREKQLNNEFSRQNVIDSRTLHPLEQIFQMNSLLSTDITKIHSNQLAGDQFIATQDSNLTNTRNSNLDTNNTGNADDINTYNFFPSLTSLTSNPLQTNENITSKPITTNASLSQGVQNVTESINNVSSSSLLPNASKSSSSSSSSPNNPSSSTPSTEETPPFPNSDTLPTGTAVPLPSDTAVPSSSGTAIPSSSGTAVPSSTETAAPSSSGKAVPSSTETAAPSSSGTKVPSSSGTAAASSSDTAVPSPSDTTESLPTDPTVATEEEDVILQIPYCITITNSCLYSFSLVLGYPVDDYFHTEGWYNINNNSNKVICIKVYSKTIIKSLPIYIYSDNKKSTGIPRATDIVSSDSIVNTNVLLKSGCVYTKGVFHYSKYEGNIFSEYINITNNFYQILNENGENVNIFSNSYSCVDIKKASGLVELTYVGDISYQANYNINISPHQATESTPVTNNNNNSTTSDRNITIVLPSNPPSVSPTNELPITPQVNSTSPTPTSNDINTASQNNTLSNEERERVNEVQEEDEGIAEFLTSKNNNFIISCNVARGLYETRKRSTNGCCVHSTANTDMTDPIYNCYKNNIPDFRLTYSPESAKLFHEYVYNGTSTSNITFHNLDNKITGYSVNDNCNMTLYTDYNFGGENIQYNNNQKGMLDNTFINNTSSMKCECLDPLHPNDPDSRVNNNITMISPATVPCRPTSNLCTGLVCRNSDCNTLDPFSVLSRSTFDWKYCKEKKSRVFCPIGYVMCNDGSCIPDPGVETLANVACERKGGGLRMTTEQCVYCEDTSCFQRNLFGKYQMECTCETSSYNGPFAPSILSYALQSGSCAKCTAFSDTAVIFKDMNFSTEKEKCDQCIVRGCPPLDPRCTFCDACVL